MDEKQLKNHQRINDILLGPLERPALAWLARKMPPWVTPDLLTATGLLASILIFASYWLTSYSKNFLWLASFGFLLNWFGDSLDGSLARYRHIERPHYGFFIDHVVDTFSEILVFVGIGLSPYVDIRIALFGLVSYLNITILVYLMMITRGFFRISMWKIGPTEIRVIAILANTAIFFIGNPSITTMFGALTLYSAVVVALAGLLLLFFAIQTFQNAATLAREDDVNRVRKQEKEAEKLARKAQKDHERMLRRGRKHVSTEKQAHTSA